MKVSQAMDAVCHNGDMVSEREGFLFQAWAQD